MSNSITNPNEANLNGEQGFLLMLLNEEVAITTAMIADYIWQDYRSRNGLTNHTNWL